MPVTLFILICLLTSLISQDHSEFSLCLLLIPPTFIFSAKFIKSPSTFLSKSWMRMVKKLSTRTESHSSLLNKHWCQSSAWFSSPLWIHCHSFCTELSCSHGYFVKCFADAKLYCIHSLSNLWSYSIKKWSNMIIIGSAAFLRLYIYWKQYHVMSKSGLIF